MHTILKSSSRPAEIRRVTVALIGCGAVSERLHAPALAKLAAEGLLETVALVDPNPQSRAKLGTALGAASGFDDVQPMLETIRPDLAIVAAPHHLHADLVVQCLEKSVAVLCEKPMATTEIDCDRMIAAAQSGNRVLAVGHVRRFMPSCQMVQTILRSGLLGPVQWFSMLEGETYSWPSQSGSFFNRSEAGGGVLMDIGVHAIDLLIWWLGDIAKFEYWDDAMGGIEANCRLRLKMANGASGIVQLSRDWPLPNRYTFNCERGWLTYICDATDLIEWGLNDSDLGLDSKIRMLARASTSGFRSLDATGSTFSGCVVDQLRSVVTAVNGRGEVRIPGTEARKSVAFIERCYRHRKLLDMPWLEHDELRKAKELTHI